MLRQFNFLGSGTQQNVKTALITSWRLQKNSLGEETQGQVKNRNSLRGSALTKPKPTSSFFYDTVPILSLFSCTHWMPKTQKTKPLERKICSQNPSVDYFNPQRRHKVEQGRWVILSFSLLILSQAWLISCDKKGDTQENRLKRMLTWKTQVNSLVHKCY